MSDAQCEVSVPGGQAPRIRCAHTAGHAGGHDFRERPEALCDDMERARAIVVPECDCDPTDTCLWHRDIAAALAEARARYTGSLWLLWSNDDRLWWCANRRGYTRFVADAGRYTLAEAHELATVIHRHHCTDDQPNPFPKLSIQPSPELLQALLDG